MIGDETGAAHDDGGVALRRQFADHVLDRRPPPRIVRAARALPRDAVVGAADSRPATRSAVSCSPSRYRQQASQSQYLQRCDAVVERAHRQRVRAEDHGDVSCARRAINVSSASATRAGEELDERRDGRDSERTNVKAGPPPWSSTACSDALDVGLHRHPGPVRRHHDADAALDAVGAHRLHALGDEGRRVLHAEVGAEPLDRCPRRVQPLDQPSACARVVSSSGNTLPIAAYRSRQLLQVLRGRARRPAADVRVVPLDVLRAARRAVGHDEHADRVSDRSRGPSVRCRRGRGRRGRKRSRATCAGSTPWPRLKMWPSRPAAAASTCRVSASTASHGDSSTAGSRFPCTPRDAGPPTRDPGVVQRRPPVDPDHVAAGLRHRPPAARRCPRRSGSSAPPARRRHPREQRPACAAARPGGTRRGGSAPTQESKTCSTCAPASACARRCGADDVGQSPHQVVPRARVAVQQRLRALVLLGRAALHQVARQGERRARRTRSTAPRAPCAAGGSPRGPRGRPARARAGGVARGRPRCTHGVVHHRAAPGLDAHRHAHAGAAAP